MPVYKHAEHHEAVQRALVLASLVADSTREVDIGEVDKLIRTKVAGAYSPELARACKETVGRKVFSEVLEVVRKYRSSSS